MADENAEGDLLGVASESVLGFTQHLAEQVEVVELLLQRGAAALCFLIGSEDGIVHELLMLQGFELCLLGLQILLPGADFAAQLLLIGRAIALGAELFQLPSKMLLDLLRAHALLLQLFAALLQLICFVLLGLYGVVGRFVRQPDLVQCLLHGLLGIPPRPESLVFLGA